jgi:hypothetical protein
MCRDSWNWQKNNPNGLWIKLKFIQLLI